MILSDALILPYGSFKQSRCMMASQIRSDLEYLIRTCYILVLIL